MKKLRLNLEDLRVDSFTTADGDEKRGTVDGYYLSERCATDALTCNGPVGGSCGGGEGASCAPTTCVVDSCGGSCPCYPDYPGSVDACPIYSQEWTGCDNCQQSRNEIGTCIFPC
jgi:hypothetical protein